jgi:hypothetical protein
VPPPPVGELPVVEPRRVVALRVRERAEVARFAGFRAPLMLVLRAPAVLLRAAPPVLLFAAVLDARVPAAFLAVLFRAVVFRAVPLRAVDFFARVPPVAERVERAELARAPPSSSGHLPVITRWAASATASAINAPSLLALDMTVVAAWEAVSAASRPASRILRRAAGLALIAAAAAASPAPSISRLIAALAILSTVDLPDRDDDFDERFFVLDLAICKASL